VNISLLSDSVYCLISHLHPSDTSIHPYICLLLNISSPSFCYLHPYVPPIGLVLIDISLRMLHKKKQSVFIAPFVSAIQYVLRETQLGSYFFKQVPYLPYFTLPNHVTTAYAMHDTLQLLQLPSMIRSIYRCLLPLE